MAEKEQAIRLSREELGYLEQLAMRDESLGPLLKTQQAAQDRSITIQLSPTEAERLRDCLTKELAAIGFGKNYSPNKQGQILENLIDKFR